MRTSGNSSTRPWLLVLTLFLALAGAVHGFEPIGLWKMCFEPGLPGVDEPSEGYLVFMPEGGYFEMRRDCCAEETISDSGTYRVEGDTVYLEKARVDGTKVVVRRLDFVGDAAVVLFDDLHGESVIAPVLRVGPDLNYGFARIYPAPVNRAAPSASLPRSPS